MTAGDPSLQPVGSWKINVAASVVSKFKEPVPDSFPLCGVFSDFRVAWSSYLDVSPCSRQNQVRSNVLTGDCYLHSQIRFGEDLIKHVISSITLDSVSLDLGYD